MANGSFAEHVGRRSTVIANFSRRNWSVEKQAQMSRPDDSRWPRLETARAVGESPVKGGRKNIRMKLKKEPCPYTGHNGCKKLVAATGRTNHIKGAHPGLPTEPDAEGNWPSVRKALPANRIRTEQGISVQKATGDYLNEALNSVKVRREVLARRLGEIETLENEDHVLAREEEAIQKAIEAVAGNRSEVGEHPMVREAHHARGHSGGAGASD